MLAQARAFFSEHSILEVDCPFLSQAASVDVYIDLMKTTAKRFLHSSPEYAMKRLLSEGIGDIYQLGHVFREEEEGSLHNPEFTLVEWYRQQMAFPTFIEETLDFLHLFLGVLPSSFMRYRQTLLHYTGIDYLTASVDGLHATLNRHGIIANPAWDREALLQLLVSTAVEPKLGRGELTVLYAYPASQAALAQTKWEEGEEIAERFEVYFQGIELANGYHELSNAQEQRLRFETANAKRLSLGKEALPIDERFLEALEKGLPDCCGVAVGFDRLMMLRHQRATLRDILPFSWKDI